ncbi:6-phosphofructokinase [Metschnikowia bicuspidata]|uniref:ATP-dependent 6-phosphofructokinase n=1 Tax=Metschnikowia bicuspidata TaxID=27322 RepID=A0A4P9ZF45_9ASCO|nr:6-phosphofructokinase [Metschnikowia bicuspidata]
MTVEGVSLISLNTADQVKFNATASFYTALGFSLVKSYSKYSLVANELKTEQLWGITHDSLREAWLQTVPTQKTDKDGNIVPWQEMPFYNGDETKLLFAGMLLKLRLVGLAPSGVLRDIRLFSCRISDTENALAHAGANVVKDATGGLQTVDPLGNSLYICNRPFADSDRAFTLPQEFWEYQSEQLMKAVPAVSSTRNHAAKKKKIAVMTSGGDSPGMSPAVRAVVRSGIFFGCDVFAVYEGYEGLVRGGKLLRKMEWEDVRGFLSHGGTDIGTARCAAFRERVGRLDSAFNMVTNGIDAFVVCGGDGSLTGADLFRSEWPSLIEELVLSGRITAEQAEPHRHLTIVGLVGSIDNDMAGTDATIGAYSALERISEMVDYIDETANSHSRAFVIEVMGRHCGWLGLMSGLLTGADYIFIPERPPKHSQWQADLKEICRHHRGNGKRNFTVIIAEGAIDDQLQPITAEHVKDVLVEEGLDTRITTLGHVQRGGSAVAYDRMLSTLQGVEAVKAVLESTPETPSPVISIRENKIVRQPLMDSVRDTKMVAAAIEAKDFDKAMSLRDSTFAKAYEAFLLTALHDYGSLLSPENERLNIGIVHVGASLSSLNPTTRAAALYCMSKGHRLLAIQNGFSGLIKNGAAKELTWHDVDGWHNRGGSEIGTNRSLPAEHFGDVAYNLQKHNLNGLLIVGGFEAFTALHQLESQKSQYPIFNIPKVVIPATVSNNVPGTEYSLGSDTCLNQLVNYCDAIKQSASLTRRRVFVVEVQGGNSGYVASYAGLVTGAMAVYTPELKISLQNIREDIDFLVDVFEGERGKDKNGKVVIRNEHASEVYSSELLADIFSEAAKGRFETRAAIPGHVQQGFTPSSMDRVFAVRFAVQSVKFIEDWSKKAQDELHSSAQNRTGNSLKSLQLMKMHSHTSVVIGIQKALLVFSDINSLYCDDTDVSLRKGKTIHWHKLSEVGDILSGRLRLRNGRKELAGRVKQ